MTNSPQDPVDLSDPSISAHRLQELAQTHPQQWDEILRHPNVYPGLADWILARQAEQSTAVPQEPMQTATIDDDVAATEEFGALDDAELDVAGQPAEEPADVKEPAADTALEVETEGDETSEAASAPWALPEESGNQQDTAERYETRSWEQQPAVPSTQPEEPAAQESASPQQHTWAAPSGYQQTQPYPDQQAGTGSYAQFGAEQRAFEQQHYGQPQPFGQQQHFGQPQQFGQPAYYAPQRRQPAAVNLSSARTWGLFVSGGAAFLGLFGFFFSPTLRYDFAFSSQVAGGGWLILLLFLATITLSLLQLLKPSAWMRFFFLVVSFGAAFAMLGRAITLIGFLAMPNTSFSVVWLLFMSLILLGGAMVYIAPSSQDNTRQHPGQSAGGAASNPGYGQQPGNQPYGGYSQQPGGYPQGGPQY